LGRNSKRQPTPGADNSSFGSKIDPVWMTVPGTKESVDFIGTVLRALPSGGKP